MSTKSSIFYKGWFHIYRELIDDHVHFEIYISKIVCIDLRLWKCRKEW